ncbi:MAG: thiamine phosphate synthase [Acidobacteriota bacterium]
MPEGFFDTGLYAITDTAIAGCSHAEIVEAITRAGGRLIQLREKQLPARDFYLAAQAAVMRARVAGALLIINDRVDIAKLTGAAGVHLGQDDLAPEKARALLGPDAIIGISTHSLAQAQAADRLPVDYIAVGPVFHTETKPAASAGVAGGQVGLELVRSVRAAISKPVVAIGGITLELAPEVLRAGAAAVAVISDLLKYDRIDQRTEEFLARLAYANRPS